MNYILNGKTPTPCSDVLKWGAWFENADRIVARDIVDDSRISTVFLGVNHAFDPSEPPELFETMVFGGMLDGVMQRYSTWRAAENGHQEMVKRVKDTTRKTAEQLEERVTEWKDRVRWGFPVPTDLTSILENALNQAVAAERDACLREVENYSPVSPGSDVHRVLTGIAKAIRGRGK